MKIAIIGGTGEQGPGLAMRWALAGEEIIIGSRQLEKAQRVAEEVKEQVPHGNVRGLENPNAAREGEVVVMTVPYSAHLSTLGTIRDGVKGKIFIDVSVPLDSENPRRMKMPPQGSAAEEAQDFFGEETKVVAAFQNVSSHLLKDLHAQIECDILICGNDRSAKMQVLELIKKIGLRGYDVGMAESARVVEGITSLLIGLNIRHKIRIAGIKITGIP
ncbi:MAG: NADPH-dependent F420 reductase [Candidatus Tectomicrobia bacterium]|nr:NADPH-dependent F420 reductase [Candidatus Tectomicrobia bacterium]